MADSGQLVNLVQSRIDAFLVTRHPILASISPELAPVADISRQFLSGGKRFRASFCYWGWRSVQDLDVSSAIISVASAMEVFHAAALVHDDIMDNSDTRRGSPSVHRQFEELHRTGGWAGDAAGYGHSSALLLGDLLLGWSDELLDEGLADLTDRSDAVAARSQFNLMRTEVTAGQYLDIREEQAWVVEPESDQLGRALRVITFKSAKYSVLAPLVIGARLGGGVPAQVDALERFGLPLGIAFQLRDDLLGVFGDPAITGKPSGDDLREGKRTVLIALARERMTSEARNGLDELLGNPRLRAEEVRLLQTDIQASGAVEEVERMIGENVAEAELALEDAPLTDAALAQLRRLTAEASDRSA